MTASLSLRSSGVWYGETFIDYSPFKVYIDSKASLGIVLSTY
jgi:hypothetical protein